MLLVVGLSGCFEEEIKTTNMSVEEIKNRAVNVSYDDLMRYNEEYVGKIVYFRGGVVQVIEVHGNEYDLRVATSGSYYVSYYEDIIWVNYEGSRILEDDIVDVWGYVKGLKAYTTVLGAKVTIPELDCFHLELIE